MMYYLTFLLKNLAVVTLSYVMIALLFANPSSLNYLFATSNLTTSLPIGSSNLTTSLPIGSSNLNTSLNVNQTCKIPSNKPMPISVEPSSTTSFGLQVSKQVNLKQISLYGASAEPGDNMPGSNATSFSGLPDKATVTLSVTGTGGITERKIPIDVVFSIDSSTSMREESDPSNLRLEAVRNFVDKLDAERDRAGMVSWHKKVSFSLDLTSEFNSLKTRLADIEAKGGTNVNLGLFSAIKILDSALQTGDTTSKSIVILTDGKGEYIPSGMPGSPADDAARKGYRVYSIGLNINNVTAENDLKDMAAATGGQYYSSPTAENLQQAFDQIFQRVVTSTAPSNVNVLEALPEYIIVQENSFTVPPAELMEEEDSTIMKWNDVSSLVGNKDNILDGNETFSVSFDISSSRTGQGVPVEIESAAVSFLDPSGQQRSSQIPMVNIDVLPFESSATPATDSTSSMPSQTKMWISVDKELYSNGEEIYIYGNVGQWSKDFQYVNLALYDKDGILNEEYEPIAVGLDGSFQASTYVNIPAWGLFTGAGDKYMYAVYGNTDACDKFVASDQHTTVGSNPGSGITIHLDKQVYRSGEVVNITGNVGKQINFSDPNIDIEVRMDVFDQSLSRPETEFIPLNEDGSFSTSFETISAGRHTVQITYDKKSSEALYVTR